MILSHKHKFIFFCNGKTGTTSIESALAEFQEGEACNINVPGLFYTNHVPPVIVKSLLPSHIWETYYKFVFVRNPWDWVVSQWKYNFEALPIQRRNQHGAIRKLRNLVRGRYGIYREQPRQILSGDDVEALYTYLRAIQIVPSADACSQWPYLLDEDGKLLVDMVGRFESLNEDFLTICDRIGVSVSLPRLNQTRASTQYTNYYTAESREAVARRWSRDIELLGYGFDQPASGTGQLQLSLPSSGRL